MSKRWQVGTMRPEEARIYDKWAGYHSFHTEETQEPFGSFEIFWRDRGCLECGEPTASGGSLAGHVHRHGPVDHEYEDGPAGWYWRSCSPGCLPDGEPSGPFATSRDALLDADEWHPEFDEAEED